MVWHPVLGVTRKNIQSSQIALAALKFRYNSMRQDPALAAERTLQIERFLFRERERLHLRRRPGRDLGTNVGELDGLFQERVPVANLIFDGFVRVLGKNPVLRRVHLQPADVAGDRTILLLKKRIAIAESVLDILISARNVADAGDKQGGQGESGFRKHKRISSEEASSMLILNWISH
jgi:hypothetical protein